MRSLQKVIHVTDDFTHDGGGVATAIAELTRALNTRSILSEIVAPRTKPALAPAGVQAHSFGADNPWLWSTTMTRHLRQTACRGSIVHVHGLWKAPQLQAAKIARQLGIPWVLTPHNMLGGWLFRRSRWKMLKKSSYLRGPGKALLSPDSVHFLSDSERERAASFFSETTNYCVIPNALNLSVPFQAATTTDLEAQRQLQGLTAGAPYFLYLGRLYEGKGIEELLQAFARCDSSTHRLVLAGSASEQAYETNLHRLVAKLNLKSQVVFAGHVSGSLKNLLLAKAKATCSISYSEGVSVSALESLKFGTPLIATREVGIPDLQRHGSVQVTREIDHICAALIRASKWTKAERATRGEASRRRCEAEFDWSVLVHKYAKWYEDTMELAAR